MKSVLRRGKVAFQSQSLRPLGVAYDASFGVAEAGRHCSKFSVAVTCLFGQFAAGKGILSSVANPRLSRPFACTTTLECHSPPPVKPKTASSLTSSSNTRSCPQISLPLSTTTKRKASTHHRTFRNIPLPQWHLLLSPQQLQAVTLALHEQTRAANGKCTYRLKDCSCQARVLHHTAYPSLTALRHCLSSLQIFHDFPLSLPATLACQRRLSTRRSAC